MSKHQPIPVLDHGYVRLVECWGHGDAGGVDYDNDGVGWLNYSDGSIASEDEDNECGIIEAARQSTQGSFRGWDNGDAKLLDFLWTKKHSTPFEFAGMVVEVQAPIIVFREWHRHRTQSYNEMSARYAPMPDVHYLPDVNRLFLGNTSNKQAGAVAGSAELTSMSASLWLDSLAALYDQSEQVYADGLARGVPKEIARLAVTVARYSRMRAQTNLRNWLAFATLRSAPDAQYEIRMFSKAIEILVEANFPRTYRVYKELRREFA